MSQAISPLFQRLARRSTAFLTATFALLLINSTCDPALAAPTSWEKPVSTQVAGKANNYEPVEALVLLDDSGEQAAEQSILQSKGLHRADVAEYREHLRRLRFRLDSLKARVKSNLAAPDLEVLQDYPALPVLHVRVASAQALDRLIRHRSVLSIDENTRNEPYLAQSLPLIGQPTAWAGGNGYGGAGATVAVLDTGVDYTRSVFGSCTSPGVPGDTCKVISAQDFAPPDGALDDHGHGTNVAGIALGVAPAAKIAALDVFRTDGYAYTSDIIAAIDWCVANKATYNIAAINMSLGSGHYHSPVEPADSWGAAIQRAVDAGIVVAAASGNNAYTDSLGLPAAYANVVSVGAVYDADLGPLYWQGCSDRDTQADKITCFSNSASFLTMLAPGAIIDAAGITMSGTSQATPHVAGAAAVLRSAFPDDDVRQSVDRLLAGPLLTDARNGVVKPRLDLVASLGVTPPSPEVVPPPPQQILQMGAAHYSVAEGVGSLIIPVTRAGATTGTVSVQYATTNGTATAGSDYTARSGTLSFADGVSTQNIVIAITNDTLFESDETFSVTLGSPVGASLGATTSATVTIVNDDSNIAAIEFESVKVSVNEGGGSITLRVRRLGNANTAASVKYATANGTAKSRSDYSAKSGTLKWPAGEATIKSIVVPIINNKTRESSETFKVNLSSSAGAILGINRTAIITIIDND